MLKAPVVPLLLIIPALVFGVIPTSVTLNTSSASAQYGEPVTFTASVFPTQATGEVAFYHGAILLETEPLINGKAAYTTSLLPFGLHSVTAYYTGNSTYGPGTSPAVAESIATVPSRGYTQPTHYPNVDTDLAPVVGDFNGDGYADVAVSVGDPTPGIQVFLGNGDGTLQPPLIDANSALVGPIAAGDFNGDGKLDLVVGDGPLSILLGNGDGTFQAPLIDTLTSAPSAIAIGDFNGDGTADLAIIGNSRHPGINIFPGNGDGTFQTPTTTGAGYSFGSMVVGDYNGDGKADLAATTSLSSDATSFAVAVLLGNGDGTFQTPLIQAVEYEPHSLAVGDFNSDGKPDLAGYVGPMEIIDGHTADVVLLGNGDGTFQPAVYYGTGGSVTLSAPIVSDFNGDGKADLISAGSLYYSATGNYLSIVVLPGKGDGTFGHADLYISTSAESNGGYPAIADFNGDGRPDFAVIPDGGDLNIRLGSIQAPTTTALSSSLNPSFFGTPVTLTAAVTPATIQGGVTFFNGASPLGTSVLSDGTATLTLSTLPVGSQSLTASYDGDNYYFTSTSGIVTQQVNQAPTSTILNSSPNPSSVGQTVTLVAEVAPVTATGNITFYHGSTLMGTVALVNGTATLTTSTLTQGTHALYATYVGSSEFLPSTSTTVNQKVE